MFDLITYCADTTALIAELQSKNSQQISTDSAGNITWKITKTPTVRKGLETLSVVRVDDAGLAEINHLTSLDILSIVNAGDDILAAMSPAKRTIYDSVYPRTPFDITDSNGVITGTRQPPELIGAFA